MRAKSYSLFFKTGCTHARNHVLLLSSNHNYNKIFLIRTVGFQLQLEIKEQGCTLHKQEKVHNITAHSSTRWVACKVSDPKLLSIGGFLLGNSFNTNSVHYSIKNDLVTKPWGYIENLWMTPISSNRNPRRKFVTSWFLISFSTLIEQTFEIANVRLPSCADTYSITPTY